MNGASNKKKRKQRMTRSKRNQLTKRVTEEQEQANDPQTSKTSDKDSKSSNSSKYTLRSGKGVGLIPQAKDYKKETAKTITQDRLTVSRPHLVLAKTKSSEWIKRGLPETESMKKKVDEDMKEMLAMAEKMRQGEAQTEVSAGQSPPTLDSTHDSMDAVQSSPPGTFMPATNSACSKSKNQKANNNLVTVSSGKKTNSITSSDGLGPINPPKTGPNPQKIGPIGDASSRTLKSSNEKEENDGADFFIPNISDVENKLLIESIANFMVKEPRSNCLKMFDNRDFAFEIRQELLQSWEDRLCKSEESEGHCSHGYTNTTPALSISGHNLYDSKSVLSSCRLSPSRNKKAELSLQEPSSHQDSHSCYIFGSPEDTGIDSSIFLPSTSGCNIEDSAQCMEPVIRLCINPEDMETDQDDYEAFFDTVRCMDEEDHLHRIDTFDDQEQLRRLNRMEHQEQLRRINSLQRQEQLRRMKAHNKRLQPGEDELSSMLTHQPLKAGTSNLFPKDPPPAPADCDWNSFMQDEYHSLPSRLPPENKYLHHKEPWHPNPGSRGKKRVKNDNMYELSLSRHRFRNALDAACGQSSMKALDQHNSQTYFSILEQPEEEELQPFDPWPQDLRSHQVDLQRQARDFLSTHGSPHRGGPFPPALQGGRCGDDGISSPTSPVFMASSVLKDMIL